MIYIVVFNVSLDIEDLRIASVLVRPATYEIRRLKRLDLTNDNGDVGKANADVQAGKKSRRERSA